MKLGFLALDENQRRRAINEAAVRRRMNPVIMEKDFWVSWMLGVLFQSSIADALVFKGGTSLSKVFGAINRFSEDIDLSVSTELLELPAPGNGRNQANKWMKQAEEACTAAARDHFLPELHEIIDPVLSPMLPESGQRSLVF